MNIGHVFVLLVIAFVLVVGVSNRHETYRLCQFERQALERQAYLLDQNYANAAFNAKHGYPATRSRITKSLPRRQAAAAAAHAELRMLKCGHAYL